MQLFSIQCQCGHTVQHRVSPCWAAGNQGDLSAPAPPALAQLAPQGQGSLEPSWLLLWAQPSAGKPSPRQTSTRKHQEPANLWKAQER